MLKTETNPDGLPMDVFDSFRKAMEKDRAAFFVDVPSGPFFGFNREGAKTSQGLIWSWWQQGMQTGFKGAYDCITVRALKPLLPFQVEKPANAVHHRVEGVLRDRLHRRPEEDGYSSLGIARG